jgi:hypothetical protein
MNILVAIILFCSSVFAAETFGQKKGFVLGVGGILSSFQFPVQFNGTTKNKIDDSQSLLGPTLQLGYDVLMFNRLLLGLRAEGFIADTLGMGSTETSKVTDKTTGKMRAGTLALRGGWVFDFHTVDLVGYNSHLVGEFFIEGGMTSGHKSFSKNYSTTDVVTESYHDNLEEEFSGRTIAAGFNVTSGGGAYFELKLMQTSILKNKQSFTGTQTVGGSTTSTNQKLEDENRKSFTGIVMNVGHHY